MDCEYSLWPQEHRLLLSSPSFKGQGLYVSVLIQQRSVRSKARILDFGDCGLDDRASPQVWSGGSRFNDGKCVASWRL